MVDITSGSHGDIQGCAYRVGCAASELSPTDVEDARHTRVGRIHHSNSCPGIHYTSCHVRRRVPVGLACEGGLRYPPRFHYVNVLR